MEKNTWTTISPTNEKFSPPKFRQENFIQDDCSHREILPVGFDFFLLNAASNRWMLFQARTDRFLPTLRIAFFDQPRNAWPLFLWSIHLAFFWRFNAWNYCIQCVSPKGSSLFHLDGIWSPERFEILRNFDRSKWKCIMSTERTWLFVLFMKLRNWYWNVRCLFMVYIWSWRWKGSRIFFFYLLLEIFQKIIL